MNTYDEIISSPAHSRILELYHFIRGAEDWFYSRGKTSYASVLSGGTTFQPLAIDRDDIDDGATDSPGSLTFRLPKSSDIGIAIAQGKNDAAIDLVVYEVQIDVPYDLPIIWMGNIVDFNIEGEIIEVRGESVLAQGDMPVPKLIYQREECTFNTYDPFTCKVDPAAFTFAGTVSAIDGLQVTVPGAEAFGGSDPLFFSGGVLTKGVKRGMIEAQSGDVMILQDFVIGLVVGDSVSLLAGDDRSKKTCKDKFNNINRFMAFSEMPDSTPWFGPGLGET